MYVMHVSMYVSVYVSKEVKFNPVVDFLFDTVIQLFFAQVRGNPRNCNCSRFAKTKVTFLNIT